MASRWGERQRRPIAGAGGLSEISEVAVRLFAEHGYGATGMKDIARALGVKAPSLYNYVGSKRELLDVLCLEGMRGMRDDLRAGVTGDIDPVVRLVRGMEAQILYRVRRPHHLQVVTRETLHLDPEVREEVRALRDEQLALWLDVVRVGVQLGLFRVPSAELASHLLLELGSRTQVTLFAGAVPERKLAADYCEFALALLQGEASR
jgi:TetR/AcrR family transcriptional regulator, cholesterol catabolism regulator